MTNHVPTLQVSNLSVGYSGISGYQVVEDVSFSLNEGETLGIVGESGCGKSTIARTVLQLLQPSKGTISVSGIDLSVLRGRSLRQTRKHIQMVFQDPYGSLDPRMTVLEIVEQPLKVHGVRSKKDRRQKAGEVLQELGISETLWNRRPAALSGGQRQRVAIARASVLSPAVTVLDEAVSALDVSVQAQVLNLLKLEQQMRNLSYLFIVHDLSIASYFCDRILVLYLGKVMEEGPAERVFANPQHPYTAALLSAALEPGSVKHDRIVLRGEPQGVRPEVGCPFAPRCPIGAERAVCNERSPEIQNVAAGGKVACHFPGELRLVGTSKHGRNK